MKFFGAGIWKEYPQGDEEQSKDKLSAEIRGQKIKLFKILLLNGLQCE